MYSQNSGTKNSHLKHIQEGLLVFLINDLSKKQRVMRHAMRKPRYLPFNILSAWLTELNNYLQLFPWWSDVKNMPTEELNEILLHDFPNGWSKQYYLQGYYFKVKSYNETYEMFERMEMAEQV